MTVYKLNGVRVDRLPVSPETDTFPTPRVSRMEPYISPVSEKEITSWSQRDAEMRAVDAYDPRDLPRDHVYKHGRAVQLKEKADG